MIENLVIFAPTVEAAHTHLRELGIPPHPFLRNRVRVVTSQRDIDGVRGLGAFLWTEVPGHRAPDYIRTTLGAMSKMRSPLLEWGIAIARHLAWKVYHEQS